MSLREELKEFHRQLEQERQERIKLARQLHFLQMCYPCTRSDPIKK